MSVTTVPLSPNGTKPHAVSLRVLPALGRQIDDLAELRALIRKSQEAERQLTAAVLTGLEAAGLTQLAGDKAVAIVAERTTLAVDPELFHQALGSRAYTALSVRVEAARRLMAEDDLAAISETTTTPVLRVEAREGERR
jgi:hypothetical protein